MTLRELTDRAMRIEAARAMLRKAQDRTSVEVADPLEMAVSECNNALAALDTLIGAAVREQERNAPKEAARPV